jgi:hypothetical protein
VTVPAAVPVPEQALLLKNVYATGPVAMIELDGVTVAVSYALAPVDSLPAHAAFVEASLTVVAVAELPCPTEKVSHGPVDPE